MKDYYMFSNLISERGYEYYVTGHVKELNETDKGWAAVVKGSKAYSVSITLKDSVVVEMDCTCPYAADGKNCKHMAAVLYAIDETPKPPEKQDKRKFINSINESKRLVYLTELLMGNEQLYARFKSRHEEISDFNVGEYIYELDRAIATHSGRGGFIDYRQTTHFEEDISLVITAFKRLCETDDHSKILEMAIMISDRVGNLEIDDSNGTVSWMMASVMEALPMLVGSPDKKVKDAVFKWICEMALIKNRNYLTDFFYEPFTTYYCKKKQLARKIELIDRRIVELNQKNDSIYYLWKWLKTKVLFMEELGTDESSIEETLLKYIHITEARSMLADRYEVSGNIDKAINILRDGINDADGTWEKEKFSNMLIGVFSKHGMKTEEVSERKDLFLLYRPSSMDYYRNYKSLFYKLEWAKERDKILSVLKTTEGTWCDIYAEEKMYIELVLSLQKSCTVQSLYKFANLLKKKYTPELLEMFMREINSMAKRTVGRNTYKEWVKVLKYMQKFNGGKEVVAEIIDDWKVRYKRRKAMMEELAKL